MTDIANPMLIKKQGFESPEILCSDDVMTNDGES